MKRLIYQVYVGARSKLYDTCTASVREYAKRIGAFYVCQEVPFLFIRPDPFTTNRSKEAVDRLGYLPIYEKENAFDLLGEYDQIAIIDSDVWIRSDAPSIFDDVLPGVDMAAVVEREMPITTEYVNKIINYSRMQYGPIAHKMPVNLTATGYPFCNMGVMVLNASARKKMRADSAKQFIRRPDFKDFVDGKGAWKWSTDQTLLNYWMMTETNWQPLDWKWNGLYGANTRIEECHFVHFFLKDKLPNRGENIKELLKNV